MDTVSWYGSLAKPWFAPAPWVFGVAWSILYPVIFASFGYVFYKSWRKDYPRSLAFPFIVNLAANLAFSPIQFTLQNNVLAAFDMIIVVASLIWAMKAVHPYSRKIAYLQLPYLIWGLFATILQFSITILNL